jgi:putative endopeptidase
MSIRPGDDFYTHVNEAWIRDHPVPADRQRYNIFTMLSDRVDDDLHTLLINASALSGQSPDRDVNLIGMFYRSGMDNATIEREGLSPLKDELARIDAIDSRVSLSQATVYLLWHGSGPLYSYFAEINPKNSTEMVAGLEQGGLGMPDRDYYLRDDAQSVEIQDAYKGHIARILILSGVPENQATTDATTIYRIEKTLAISHLTAEDNLDPEKTTHIVTLDALKGRYPNIGWDQLAAIPGSGCLTKVNIHQPVFLETLDRQLAEIPLEEWRVYLKYHLINSAAPYLGQKFEDENFAFYGTRLLGIQKMKPRWKRVVATESEALRDLVGKAYVSRYVDPRTKDMVQEMFLAIRQTFDARIANLTWMTEPTKRAAREKLSTMRQKIAYPDQWEDFAGLNLSGSYVTNVRSAAAYSLIHGPSGLAKIGSPIDPTVWFMSPQTVNAYYDPTRNEMVSPAAILKPPFFDPDADAAQNYGGLGTVIGHEMTHGFDNNGRKFDKDGNLMDWWTEPDEKAFNSNAALLINQYNGFEILPGLYNNGNLTLGENIADFGGATLAYHAGERGRGFTAPSAKTNTSQEQQFFFSAARIWAGNIREEALRNQVYTDPHTTAKYRVNGALFNVPEFYDAFPEILSTDQLYRNESQRPIIW